MLVFMCEKRKQICESFMLYNNLDTTHINENKSTDTVFIKIF